MVRPLPPLRIGQHITSYPIVQGAMAVRVSGAMLAGTVANSGGVGMIASLGLGLVSPYFHPRSGKGNFFEANRLALIDELNKARLLSPDGVIGVNVLVATRDYAAIAHTAAAHGADVIVAGAGLPLDLPEHTADFPQVALVPAVSSVEMAATICETWKKRYNRLPDAFIVENCRVVGGHFGTQCEQVDRSTFSIANVLSQLRQYLIQQVGVSLPLIAAGGISKRADIDQMLSLGAAGVQVGTRFIPTKECDGDRRYKDFHLQASANDVVAVPSPVGKPARALRNAFTEQAIANSPDLERRCVANCLQSCLCRDAKTTYCIIQALARAACGDVDNGLVFSGATIGQVDRIMSVAEVMAELTCWQEPVTVKAKLT